MLIGVLALLVAVQSAPAQQRNDKRTWYQAYADAQREIQQKNWPAAIADIEAASRLGAPKPGRNVFFYGDVYRDFNPDYYLGIAFLNLNRYDDADRAFERVKQAGLIAPRDNLFAEFTRQATAVKDALEKQAASQLAAADTTQGPPPAPTPPAPNPPAVEAPQNQQQPAPQPTNQQPANPQPPPPEAPNPQTPIQRPAPQTPVQQSPRNPAPRSPSPVASAEERAALVDFFSGEYQRAANTLSALAAKSIASPRAYFYLACSRAALALTGRQDPAAALADARAQLALANDTGQFAADIALISPRITKTLGIRP